MCLGSSSRYVRLGKWTPAEDGVVHLGVGVVAGVAALVVDLEDSVNCCLSELEDTLPHSDHFCGEVNRKPICHESWFHAT